MPKRAWVVGLRVVLLAGAIALLFAIGFAGAQEKTKKLPLPSKPMDINSATLDQLHSLPGVGPVTAQRILDYRKKSGPFQRVEDLLAVRGISSARLEKIRPYVMVKDAAATPAKVAPSPKTSTPPKTATPSKATTPPKKQTPPISHQFLN